MQILKGHSFRLNLSVDQAELCARTAGICRFLWNLALEQRSLAWKHGRHSVGYQAQAGELAEYKHKGIKLVCPHKKKRLRKATQKPNRLVPSKRRWKIERLHAWLGCFRCRAVQYEVKPIMYLAFIHLACALIVLRWLSSHI